MNKNNFIVGLIAVLIGIAGANIFNSRDISDMRQEKNRSEMMQGMHMMSDGKMMKNDGMDSMMYDMVANMKGKTGKELEKAFLVDMVPHHQGAVDMAKLLLEDKTIRPELVKFANDIITAQESEIKQMNEWLKSY